MNKYSEACRLFTSCGESEKIFGSLMNDHKLSNCIQKYSVACRLFTSCGESEKCLGHSGMSTSLVPV